MGKHYKEAEEKIAELIGIIKQDRSKAQKLALIDCFIAMRITYSFEQGTEIFDEFIDRSLWEIVIYGQGVCNGISQLEQYMLQRVGIES